MKKINKNKLKKDILEIFRENPKQQYNYKQIAKKLKITNKSKNKLLIKILSELTKAGKLIEVRKGKYQAKIPKTTVTGILNMLKRRKAQVYSEEINEDIFILQSNLGHALHQDKVEVSVFARTKRPGLEGEIIKVLERGKELFVGTISIRKSFAFLILEYQYMPYDIFIPLRKINGAKNGDKAIAKIIEWPEGAKSPIGEIVEVLGKSGEHEVEMHAILAEFDLPHKFEENVNRATKRIKVEITEEEIKKRRDFREVTTLTIDPYDAKDFDDALSVEKLKNGNYEIGIHIADVTHYVKPGTLIDKEALNRATSVYLVDRVVPMIPEKLSNNICSLQPLTDKLTFSAVFEIDKNGIVLNQWFGKTIINSNHRFNYVDAQNVIDTKEGTLNKDLLILNDLAQKLRQKRYKSGALSFERSEMKFKIDENGKPVSVYFVHPTESHQLVEEFMLLANKKVAAFVGQKRPGYKPKTFVYRVHDDPDMSKLNDFSNFIKKFGHNIKLKSKQKVASNLNQLFSEIRGQKESEVIQLLAIRAMAKAEYTTDNIGHYGLSFDYYTHFTSPIRRYPDMLSHRLLDNYLQGKQSANKQIVEKKCRHSSKMEYKAIMAERASKKYKAVEFMQDKIGQEFKGIISGMTQFGFFVEIIENKIEGFVLVKELEDDIYYYDEVNFCLVGHYSKKKFQMGDEVNISILRTNIKKRQLDFKLIE